MLQGYNEFRLLKTSIRKFYDRFNDLVCKLQIIIGPYTEWFVSYPFLDCRFHTDFVGGSSLIPNFDWGRTAGMSGQQRMLTSAWHPILFSLLSGVYAALHSTLYLLFALWLCLTYICYLVIRYLYVRVSYVGSWLWMSRHLVLVPDLISMSEHLVLVPDFLCLNSLCWFMAMNVLSFYVCCWLCMSWHLIFVPDFESRRVLRWLLAMNDRTFCVGSWLWMLVNLALVIEFVCLDTLCWFLAINVFTSCVGSWLYLSVHLVLLPDFICLYILCLFVCLF
jgi:hypothetical protein